MPKSIIGDVFGELLETGKATVKAGIKAVSSQKPSAARQDVSGLDWLEKMAPAKKPAATVQDDDKQQKEQIKKLSEMDKRRSRQAYEEIQRQVQLIRRQKASQPRKYMIGAAGFDEEQVKAPETFFEKMKKKKEEMAKKLPWTSKQGRGVSG